MPVFPQNREKKNPPIWQLCALHTARVPRAHTTQPPYWTTFPEFIPRSPVEPPDVATGEGQA